MDAPLSESYNTPANRPERRGVSRESVISEAKAKVSTIDLADRLCGLGQMRRIGENGTARCPLPGHEDRNPSFVVYPKTNSWFCFACLVGGDVIELARHAWGYEKSEVGTAAAMLLMEFGFEVLRRPPSYFRRRECQKSIRGAIEDACVEVMMRRLWRWIFEPILADLEDAEERARVANELWATVRPLAVRLVEDRNGTA